MVGKILIVEDIDSIGTGIKSWLTEQYPTADIRLTKYCDEALLKVRRSVAENALFDLVITDLNFKDDHLAGTITTGDMLVEQLRKIQPDINIIVYTIDDKPHKIHTLVLKHRVNGFVAKGRNSHAELLKAIEKICNAGATYISPSVLSLLNKIDRNDVDDEDVAILELLSKGFTQPQISGILKDGGFHNSSTSTIEKRLNKLKTTFKASNTLHLVIIARDLGII